jgi:hypothetical protein
MVQIVENWAEVVGQVKAITGSDKGPDYRTMALDVEAVEDVEGFPNLVAGAAGSTLDVIVRSDAMARSGVGEGADVRLRVRKATPFEVFAAPDGPRPSP